MHVRRPWMSATERNDVWRRWLTGESPCDIAEALQRARAPIYKLIQAGGGVAPRPRRRAPRTLSSAEREEISRALARRESMRGLARRLGRAASTISREVRRHGGGFARNPPIAGRGRDVRRPVASRPRRGYDELWRRNWRANGRPRRLRGWLRATFPGDPDMQVSHETIYRTLFVQSRGVLKRELLQHLRRHRPIRRARGACNGSRAD